MTSCLTSDNNIVSLYLLYSRALINSTLHYLHLSRTPLRSQASLHLVMCSISLYPYSAQTHECDMDSHVRVSSYSYL